jgi:hypothetical protein
MNHSITLTATVGLLIALAGCASTTTSSSDAQPNATITVGSTLDATAGSGSAVRAWADNGGSTALADISTDLSKVSTDLNSRDLTALQTSCAKLTADVETDQAGAAVPDKTATIEWNLALTHLQKAASSCTMAASANDPSQLDAMSSELSIGLDHFNAFNARLHQLVGG